MPFGLSTTEFSTIVGGLFTLWFSGKAYVRAGSAETRAKSAEERAIKAEASAELAKKQALELAVAGRVQTARVDLRSIEAAYDTELWSLKTLQLDAALANCSATLEACDEQVTILTRYRDAVSSSIRGLLEPVDPKLATHDDLLLLEGKLNPMIKEMKEDLSHHRAMAKDTMTQLTQLLANEKASLLLKAKGGAA